uniref:HDC19675 n=1 Tax=Drosophila melanogaster TaxID=7227 RepID=Q6II55_DROME|nr:TPA_inf: HDC19675 [Drosophila melanogaster]
MAFNFKFKRQVQLTSRTHSRLSEESHFRGGAAMAPPQDQPEDDIITKTLSSISDQQMKAALLMNE